MFILNLGVGFVRFVNERDAINALESLQTHPLILPECLLPVEAKFADKHSSDTRRRRYAASGGTSTSLSSADLSTSVYNNLVNCSPFYSPNRDPQDSLNNLLNNINPVNFPSTKFNTNAFNNLSNPDLNLKYSSYLIPNFIHNKLANGTNQTNPTSVTNTNNAGLVNSNSQYGLSDFNSTTNDVNNLNFNALTAAVSSIFNVNPNCLLNDFGRANLTYPNGSFNPSANGSVFQPSPISLLNCPNVASINPKLIESK